MFVFFFFFKQKTAYEMSISDWSSDVCSSDLCGLEADRREEFELLRALDVSFEQCAIDCEKAIEQPQFRANFPGCGYFLVEAIQHIDRTGWKSQASGGGDQRFTRSDWIEAAGFEPLAIAGIDRCLARELVSQAHLGLEDRTS